MKTYKNILLIFGAALFFCGCKKEELPPVKCFTYTQEVNFPPLTNPIDSVVFFVDDGQRRLPLVLRNITTHQKWYTEACGLFKYKVTVYNSKPNPPIDIILHVDNVVFRREVISGSGDFEGN